MGFHRSGHVPREVVLITRILAVSTFSSPFQSIAALSSIALDDMLFSYYRPKEEIEKKIDAET